MRQILTILFSLLITFNIACKKNPVPEGPESKVLTSILKNEFIRHEDLRKIKDKKQLRVIRNAVYARHGYIFNSPELKKAFAGYAWYKEKSRDITKDLTKTDKHNLMDIQFHECRIEFDKIVSAKEKKLSPEEKELTGIWQGAPIMASGWDKSYAFYPNKKFVFRGSQMDCSKRLILMIGDWELKNNVITITYFTKQVITGGEYIDELPCGKQIINGRVFFQKIEPPEILEFTMTTIKPDPGNMDTPKVKFNNKNYWKMRFNPYNY